MSGVLFNIGTLALRSHRWIVIALQLNPAALYITLMRNSLLLTQRESTPGSKPFDARLCAQWVTLGHKVGAPAKYQMQSAYCHYYANPDHFWYYAIGWAAVAIVAGFYFFWRAEAKYGRG
jgi:hypothetical protein